MAYGILFLRIVVGSLLFAHGAQKLFGWFGGHGPRGTAGFFGSLGFPRRYALPMAVLAGLSEAAGALLVLGFLTPLACLAIATVMVVAVGTVHRRNGLWSTAGGYEFNLVLWTVAIAIAASGPGRFSLDGALDWAGTMSGVWWGLGVLVGSLLSGFAVMALRETPHDAADADAPLARASDERELPVGAEAGHADPNETKRTGTIA
jgi:putative oxidoreductase